MKSLSPDLQAHLDEGTKTLAWCWRIARADGVTFGFTDHDRTLSFDGTDFEPESGLTASEVRSGSDLSVDAQDAEGVLTSDRITETDILDGRWDNAEVEVWRANWADTGRRASSPSRGPGSARRTTTRRACAASAAIASGWHGASGAKWWVPSRSRSRPTAGTGARPGCARCWPRARAP